MASKRLPQLPQLLKRKIYKTGQTRGADDDEIYQNRVGRWGTVLIPHGCWKSCDKPQDGDAMYENGFIVLLSPAKYFSDQNIARELEKEGLALGRNALVFYETRDEWAQHEPAVQRWNPATQRTNPLGGQYVARIPATTAAENGDKIIKGFNATQMKGAGIRVYEYASSKTIDKCRLQLEALYWRCADSEPVAVENGMKPEHAANRKAAIITQCEQSELLDVPRLTESRILNKGGHTVCPLCLKELSGAGFFSRMQQAEGREVGDLTITQVNLFHIKELRYGELNHRPYNLGWGASPLQRSG